MRRRLGWLGLVLGCATAVLGTGSASAQQDVGGHYLGIRAIGSLAKVDDTNTRGFLGSSLVQNDDDEVAGAAGVLGWAFREFPARVELEAGYRFRFDWDVRDVAPARTVDYEINVATVQAVVNTILEWRNSSSFTPFVGATVGWARNIADTQRTVLATQFQFDEETSKDNLAYGGLAGVSWRLAESFSLDLMYRYINLGEVETGVVATGEVISSDDYTSHDILFSAYYHF